VTRLVVGLGNPGSEYEWTPHNVGFHVVERLAADARSIFEPATVLGGLQLSAPCLVARVPTHDALLVKPLGWMNRSGAVVAPLATRLQVALGDLLVVYDDIDLPLGALRIRPHGGTGGHRGVASIVEVLGSDQFPRLRVGVGRPRTDAARHVLTRMAGDELENARVSVAEAAEALFFWLEGGSLERTMTRFHSRWNPARTEQPSARPTPRKETS
jgi:PTH1 family peptidyl-tRNA hydrolase